MREKKRAKERTFAAHDDWAFHAYACLLKQAPGRARDGSSLKDLLLSGHLFKNRCSYLIYSDSFLDLPPPLQRRIYARLSKALNPEQPDPRYKKPYPGTCTNPAFSVRMAA
jgi:hypothetical protein